MLFCILKPIPMSDFILQRSEEQFATELKALKRHDDRPKPEKWNMSPWAVVDYIMGDVKVGRTTIQPKYFGDRKLIEVAVATLASDRALLLSGIPGTAKSWVAEHLAAAISGDSSLVVQATAGTDDTALRYSWDYARLLAKGPDRKAVVPSPIMRAMEEGRMVRIEELTRMNTEVQDALISILSEKVIHISELNLDVRAQRGFNVIATANDKDRGINPLSSALQRRFNRVYMPLPKSLEEEVTIITHRVKALGEAPLVDSKKIPAREIERLTTIFRELRDGKTTDEMQKVRTPSATLSTAEAISVIHNARIMSQQFGKGIVTPEDLAHGLENAIVRDSGDREIWTEYVETVMKNRSGWEDLYEVCQDQS